MRKLLALILCLVSALGVFTLTACEGGLTPEVNPDCEHDWKEIVELNSKVCTKCGAYDGFEVTEEKWELSIDESAFDNVTISFTFNTVSYEIKGLEDSMMPPDSFEQDFFSQGAKQVQVLKIADGKIYRSITVYDKDGNKIQLGVENGEPVYNESVTFIGQEAKVQKKLFTDMFIAAIEDYSKYTFDKETALYVNDGPVITSSEQGVTETMTDLKVKFDSNFRLAYFTNHHVETVDYSVIEGIPMGDVQVVLTGDIVWTYSDYGTTVID